MSEVINVPVSARIARFLCEQPEGFEFAPQELGKALEIQGQNRSVSGSIAQFVTKGFVVQSGEKRLNSGHSAVKTYKLTKKGRNNFSAPKNDEQPIEQSEMEGGPTVVSVYVPPLAPAKAVMISALSHLVDLEAATHLNVSEMVANSSLSTLFLGLAEMAETAERTNRVPQHIKTIDDYSTEELLTALSKKMKNSK